MIRKFLLSLSACLLVGVPAFAGTTHLGDLVLSGDLTVGDDQTITGDTAITGSLSVTGTSLHTGAVTNSSTLTQSGVATFTLAPVLTTGTITANGDTNTIPDLGNASFVMTEGTQTINGTKTFSTAPTITGGLTAANIQTGSAKRQTMVWFPASNVAGGTLADGATYRGYLPIGRAATIKQVNCLCGTVPAGGTNTVKVLKASSSGNTMLSAATFDPTTLTNDTITSPALTATGADLGVTAAQGVYVEWVAGTQTTDGVNCAVSVEYEPTDF